MSAEQYYPVEGGSVPIPTVKDLEFYREVANWSALLTDKGSISDDRIYKVLDASGSPDQIQGVAIYAYDADSDTIVLIAEVGEQRLYTFLNEPTISDDVGDGYKKGDIGVYNGGIYICVDNASANAVWKNMNDYYTQEEVNNLIDDIELLAGPPGDDGNDGLSMSPQGTWSAITTYSKLQGVTYEGSFYVSVVDDNTGNNPSTAVESWSLVSKKGDTGVGISSITRTSGDGSPGSTDTYTITYTDSSTSTFEVYNGSNGIDGEDGLDGNDGNNAYEVAVANGFIGTEVEWLASLVGPQGPSGSGAYTTQIVTTDYSLATAQNTYIGCNVTTGSITVTIPALLCTASLQGIRIAIQKIVNSVNDIRTQNNVILTTDDTDNIFFNIEGYPQSTHTITLTGRTVLLQYDHATSTFYAI